jgi:hypothetical protein
MQKAKTTKPLEAKSTQAVGSFSEQKTMGAIMGEFILSKEKKKNTDYLKDFVHVMNTVLEYYQAQTFSEYDVMTCAEYLQIPADKLKAHFCDFITMAKVHGKIREIQGAYNYPVFAITNNF